MSSVEFVSAILLVSREPEQLVAFYRDALGMAMREERHDDTAPHWGCELGDIHFAIHPVENFADEPMDVGAIKLAFAVFDLDSLLARCAQYGVTPLYPVRDAGFARLTALRDPAGNVVELTELSESWMKHLEKHRAQGADILQRWRAQRGGTR